MDKMNKITQSILESLQGRHVHVYSLVAKRYVCGILEEVYDEGLLINCHEKIRLVLAHDISTIAEASLKEVCPIPKFNQMLQIEVPLDESIWHEMADRINYLLKDISQTNAQRLSQSLHELTINSKGSSELLLMVNEALEDYIKNKKRDF